MKNREGNGCTRGGKELYEICGQIYWTKWYDQRRDGEAIRIRNRPIVIQTRDGGKNNAEVKIYCITFMFSVSPTSFRAELPRIN